MDTKNNWNNIYISNFIVECLSDFDCYDGVLDRNAFLKILYFPDVFGDLGVEKMPKFG